MDPCSSQLHCAELTYNWMIQTCFPSPRDVCNYIKWGQNMYKYLLYWDGCPERKWAPGTGWPPCAPSVPKGYTPGLRELFSRVGVCSATFLSWQTLLYNSAHTAYILCSAVYGIFFSLIYFWGLWWVFEIGETQRWEYCNGLTQGWDLVRLLPVCWALEVTVSPSLFSDTHCLRECLLHTFIVPMPDRCNFLCDSVS